MNIPDLNEVPQDAEPYAGDDLSANRHGRHIHLPGGNSATLQSSPPPFPGQTTDNAAEDRFPPVDGMLFQKARDVIDYYIEYGREMGFPTRIESTERLKEKLLNLDPERPREYGDNFTKIRLFCGRGGHHKPTTLNPNANYTTMKTGCNAHINANLGEDGYWKLTTVALLHNHDFAPEDVRFMPQYRNVTKSDMRRILNNDTAGIGIANNYASFAVEAGGWSEVPFRERDMRNFINRARRMFMQNGDFTALQKLFKEYAKRSPDFYYAFNRNEAGVLQNVFWADGRSRAAYREFGDVLTFDATYLKNRYKLPFATFIGVNHHGQSTLFGCALVSNEDTESYTWVFTEFLKCMGQIPPTAILTDQCTAMGNAIKEVFPETLHRWCIWHVKENADKAIKKHRRYKELKKVLDKVVYNMLTQELFEEGWKSMVDEYKLQANKWMNKMYLARERWAPVYFRHQFWAGMSSTQRSEGMNNFFRGYFNENTSLLQFGEQYNLAHAKRVEDEAAAQSSSNNRPPLCKTNFGWEEQFRAVYTTKKFTEFQRQLCSMQYQKETVVIETGGMREYLVKDTSSRSLQIKPGGLKFTVVYDAVTEDVQCICKKFEFRGILCKHALCVLLREEVYTMPEKYVLKRWRKDVERGHLKYSVPLYSPIAWRRESRLQRQLQIKFDSISELVLGDSEMCDELVNILDGFGAKHADFVSEKNATTLFEVHDDYTSCNWSDNSSSEEGGSKKRKGSGVIDPPDMRSRGRTRLYRTGHWKKKPKQAPQTPQDASGKNLTPGQKSDKSNKGKAKVDGPTRGKGKKNDATKDKGTKAPPQEPKTPKRNFDSAKNERALSTLVKTNEKKTWLTM